VYLGLDTKTKKKQYITRTVHGTKRQAEEILNELLVEAGHGSHAIVDGTVGDLAQRWLALASPSLSPTTDAEYRRLLDRLILPRFSKIKVRSLTAADLDSSMHSFSAAADRAADRSARRAFSMFTR